MGLRLSDWTSECSKNDSVRQCICLSDECSKNDSVRLWCWRRVWVQLQLVASSGSAGTGRPQGRLDWRPTQTVRGLKARHHWGLRLIVRQGEKRTKKEPELSQDRDPDMNTLQPIKPSSTWPAPVKTFRTSSFWMYARRSFRAVCPFVHVWVRGRCKMRK